MNCAVDVLLLIRKNNTMQIKKGLSDVSFILFTYPSFLRSRIQSDADLFSGQNSNRSGPDLIAYFLFLKSQEAPIMKYLCNRWLRSSVKVFP